MKSAALLSWTVGMFVLGHPGAAAGQNIGIDSANAAATAALRPNDDSTAAGKEIPADSTLRRRTRVGTAALGFLAGAGAGLIIAHIVNQTQDRGEGKLETYIGLPLVLGLFTFATVFVALGD
jgi:hypothetical protein